MIQPKPSLTVVRRSKQKINVFRGNVRRTGEFHPRPVDASVSCAGFAFVPSRGQRGDSEAIPRRHRSSCAKLSRLKGTEMASPSEVDAPPTNRRMLKHPNQVDEMLELA